jgi:hypothetical protein
MDGELTIRINVNPHFEIFVYILDIFSQTCMWTFILYDYP